MLRVEHLKSTKGAKSVVKPCQAATMPLPHLSKKSAPFEPVSGSAPWMTSLYKAVLLQVIGLREATTSFGDVRLVTPEVCGGFQLRWLAEPVPLGLWLGGRPCAPLTLGFILRSDVLTVLLPCGFRNPQVTAWLSRT